MIFNNEGKKIYEIADALRIIEPNAQWRVVGEPMDFNNIQWESEDIAQPSNAAITTKLAEMQAEYDAVEYQRQRQPEYPSLAELADAVYWQSKGNESKMTAYLSKVQAVKDKYPKP